MSIARRSRAGWGVLLLALLVLSFACLRAFTKDTAHTTSPSKTGRGFAWREGHVYEYLLRYDTLQHAAAGLGSEEGIGGAMQLEATFELMVHEARANHFVLSATLTDVKHAKLVMAEQPLWNGPADAAATFASRRMFFEADTSGKILSVTGPKGSDAQTRLFGHTMQTLLTELQVQLASSGAAWAVEEPTLYGVVESAYQERSDGTLLRERKRVRSLRISSVATGDVTHSLDATHHVALSSEHVLERLEGNEELSVSSGGKELQRVSTRIAFTLSRTERVDVSEIARTQGETHPLSDWGVTADSERDHLEQRIAGLTFEELLDTVLAMGAGAERTDQARFLWRATGLLTLHPELCAKLIPLAAHEGASQGLRALTLDVLSGVPSEAATNAMVAILRAASVREDEAYPLYLQRLGMQTVATDEAFQLVESVFHGADAAKDPDALFASAYTLGSLAREAGERSPQQQRAIGQLRTSLEQARAPDSIAHYVRALGNVGSDAVLDDVRSLRAHDDSEVRKAVATALSSIRADAAEQELLGLVGDASPAVQREAIRGLYERKVGAGALAELNRAIERGVDAANVPYLLDILKRLRRTDPQAVDETLAILLGSGTLTREQRQLALALQSG